MYWLPKLHKNPYKARFIANSSCNACNERNAFYTSKHQNQYQLWSYQNMCEALTYLLDNVFIRFGTKLCRQIVGIPMGTNCAPLIVDLFLFRHERDFMASLSYDKEAEIIHAFNSSSRYLDDLLNIDSPDFEDMVRRIYPPELQLNKANASDTEAPFWIYIYLFQTGLFHPKFMISAMTGFGIVNLSFLDGGFPRSTSYCVNITFS